VQYTAIVESLDGEEPSLLSDKDQESQEPASPLPLLTQLPSLTKAKSVAAAKEKEEAKELARDRTPAASNVH
jgi:predicted NAD-dependent protein-ADP-ribosyltransferase YbiA (DUF1768 family)